MLILQGLLRAATTIGGSINKKTGEAFPSRNVLQIETTDARGLVQVSTITVPDLAPFQSQIGKSVDVPVRAWASGATVNFMYEGAAA